MNVEPHRIDPNAENRLNHTDDQHSDILATSPESPTQQRDDRSSYQKNQEEAEDVIPVIDIGADCPRREKMSEETDGNEYYAEPGIERLRRARGISG
jgi:hypothetical protein